MGERKNKTFSKSFKEEAVRLMEQSGRPAGADSSERGRCLSGEWSTKWRIRAVASVEAGIRAGS